MKERVAVGPCCFCGEHIAPTSEDPCRLTVETSASRWQVWYCHERCFQERVALPGALTQNGAELR